LSSPFKKSSVSEHNDAVQKRRRPLDAGNDENMSEVVIPAEIARARRREVDAASTCICAFHNTNYNKRPLVTCCRTAKRVHQKMKPQPLKGLG
jgi:hypothetical protein